MGQDSRANLPKELITLTWLQSRNSPTWKNLSYPNEVRKSIDGLPFTPEGYEKAKSILKERYGNDSEVEKAYVKDILELPKVSGNQRQKIDQFYERLLYNVQSLETLGILNKMNGNVALTIYKLPGIRGDLVRNVEDWQSWDFLQLWAALKSWTRRNPVESNSVEPPLPSGIQHAITRSQALCLRVL